MLRSAGLISPYQVQRALRHRQTRQRRRLLRLTAVYNLEGPPARSRPLAAYRLPDTGMVSTGLVLHIGDYMVGDAYCPYLHGPIDMRY